MFCFKCASRNYKAVLREYVMTTILMTWELNENDISITCNPDKKLCNVFSNL